MCPLWEWTWNLREPLCRECSCVGSRLKKKKKKKGSGWVSKGFVCKESVCVCMHVSVFLTVPLRQAARRSGRSAGRRPVCIWWPWRGLCWPEPLRCCWRKTEERDRFNMKTTTTTTTTSKNPLASYRIQSELAHQNENKDMTDPKGGFAEEQRSLKCWLCTLTASSLRYWCTEKRGWRAERGVLLDLMQHLMASPWTSVFWFKWRRKRNEGTGGTLRVHVSDLVVLQVPIALVRIKCFHDVS